MVAARQTSTDGELLRASKDAGAAFGIFYDRYEAIVAGYLLRRTQDAELTADLTSETFATALLQAHRFRDDGQPAAGWLLGIARHSMLRTWERGRTERRALKRLGLERLTLSDESIERIDALSAADDPDNPLWTALGRLPPDQSSAIRAHILEERSYDELASELGIPAATVRQRVSRGVTKLRTSLNGRHP